MPFKKEFYQDIGRDIDPSKRSETQVAHDDSPARSEPGFIRSSAAGRAQDVDDVDDEYFQRSIKNFDNQFPGSKLMPGNVDEAKWKKAKEAAKEGYPGLSEDDDKFWKITQSIYKNMKSEKELSSEEKIEKKLSTGFADSTTKQMAASDNPTHEVEATDPMRLEIKKDLGKPDPVEGIQSASDHYMKKLSSNSTIWDELCKKVCGPNCQPMSSGNRHQCYVESETDAQTLVKAIKQNPNFTYTEFNNARGGIIVKALDK